MPCISWLPQAPLQRLHLDWLARAGVEVAVLRLDLIDPLISGNKWFKLSGHLVQAAETGAAGLISLGGAHSNHLHALAAAGQRFGFDSVGLLRGHPQQTPTVRDLQSFGMRLHWLGYGGYRQRYQAGFWDAWQARYPGYHCIDEGAAGMLGAQGCMVLRQQVQEQLAALGWADYHGWWLAVGSGTTLAGLVLAEQGQRMVHGALAIPEGQGVVGMLQTTLASLPESARNYRLVPASRGAFAKVDGELAGFMGQTEHNSGMPLEPVYTAKALMALRQQVLAGYFPAGTRLIFLHTGGLQGRRALLPRLRELAREGGGAVDFSAELDAHE